ncbi:MAG: hydantoinase B/oxoprolinase family protein [Candidatus Tectomicrobia bacterium]|nr:hydantoinase B/oxoprolinase family protein [Candidatus Tectomicrobia bacterium]
MPEQFDPITLEILWSRLIAIADEAAATLVRTSFSTVVRESNDFACVVLNARGHALAQGSPAVPSFLGTLPRTVKAFLKVFPGENLKPGDVIVSNDPWIGTGHLPDLNMARPIFYKEKLIGFIAVVSHLPDIGGRIRSPDAREVFEEGLRIPVSKLFFAGKPNEQLFEIISANVRVPDQVLGDIQAQLTSTDMAGRKLVALLEEQGLNDLDDLSRAIEFYSERAMEHSISEIPKGVYRHRVTLDGFYDPLMIQAAVHVEEKKIRVDYEGTSPQLDRALNVVPNYCYAYTFFAVKCVVNPSLPNNEGCYRAVEVTAPEGCMLNPIYPAPVGARAITGHLLPTAVFGALAEAIPDRVPAPAGSPLWGVQITGLNRRGERFANLFFINGGQGGFSNRDGQSVVSFPSNVSNTPVEVIESQAPLLIERKVIQPNSGGAGRFRGGCGQEISMKVRSHTPLTVSFLADRTKFPAPGLFGGRPGQTGIVTINGKRINPKEQQILKPDDILMLRTPGGGGYGNPEERAKERIKEDIENGLVYPE